MLVHSTSRRAGAILGHVMSDVYAHTSRWVTRRLSQRCIYSTAYAARRSLPCRERHGARPLPAGAPLETRWALGGAPYSGGVAASLRAQREAEARAPVSAKSMLRIFEALCSRQLHRCAPAVARLQGRGH